MSIQSQINRLESELKTLKSQQKSCQHKYANPFQDFDIEEEGIYENKPMGSDFFNPVYAGSKKVHVPVWRRECTLCGFVETTKKTIPVVTSYSPVF